MNEPHAALNKTGQLIVVVAGFFTAVAVLVREPFSDRLMTMRVLITLAVAIALAVRYWWVILLLDWPFQPTRTALLLLAWSALVVAAARVGDAQQWGLALASLAAAGAFTEAYNTATGQWRRGSAELNASLWRDHIIGLATAAVAAVLVFVFALSASATVLTIVAAVMAVGDWGRLIEMISRHRRLMLGEARDDHQG